MSVKYLYGKQWSRELQREHLRRLTIEAALVPWYKLLKARRAKKTLVETFKIYKEKGEL